MGNNEGAQNSTHSNSVHLQQDTTAIDEIFGLAVNGFCGRRETITNLTAVVSPLYMYEHCSGLNIGRALQNFSRARYDNLPFSNISLGNSFL